MATFGMAVVLTASMAAWIPRFNPALCGSEKFEAMNRALLGVVLCAALIVGLVAFALADALSVMVAWWQREEYSHSFLVPLIACFLFWQRLPRLRATRLQQSWVGVLLVAASLAMALVGEMSAIYTVVQYGFVSMAAALVMVALGVRGFWIVAPALGYLLFMVPLPNFLYNNLSQSLQLISSELGVVFVRLFGISVHLEGNVIDLGNYQLQVVEACSGLRYLFPLLSFGYLLACLYQAPLWQRALIVLSTGPITVLMNSIRIGVTGVLVDRWGTAMAEGFLHFFEGWVIFIACLGVLLLEIWILHRLSGGKGSAFDLLDLSVPSASAISLKFSSRLAAHGPLMTTLVLAVAFATGMQGIETREEAIPKRESFLRFALQHEGWLGRENMLDHQIVSSLKLTDYLMADYSHSDHSRPVSLYIAYYDSQRKGASVHSPRSCLPGGGWVIEDFWQIEIDPGSGLASPTSSLRVNRAFIRLGENRQLVYYWFKQRNRVMTNEYAVKWFLFWDSLTRNRTDGALVRLVVAVPEGKTVETMDSQLRHFMQDFLPLINRAIPE